MEQFPGEACAPVELFGGEHFVNLNTGDAEPFITFPVHRDQKTGKYRIAREIVADIRYESDDGLTVDVASRARLVISPEMAARTGGSLVTDTPLLAMVDDDDEMPDNGIRLPEFPLHLAFGLALVVAGLWLLWGWLR